VSQSVAVDVMDVSKRFRLYHEKVYSIKERVLRAGRNPYEDFWALRDVAFEIGEGETVGILGRNGSGKSTLLKCISGILQPTEGKVVVRGQLAALLELGAGFQAELSGRENIYLNASLLGLSTKDIERRFDEIVAFAELEQFIDNQVKYYSSGMYVRLGFAVAVNVDPDILVIDEVLAVGDENFQRKCLDRIKSFQEDGRTILFVTHAPDLVRQICDSAVVLNQGRMVGSGSPGEGVRLFREIMLESSGPLEVTTTGEPEDGSPEGLPGQSYHEVLLTGVDIEHPGSGSRPYVITGEPLTVHVAFEAARAVDDVVFVIEIREDAGGLIFRSDTEILGYHYDAPAGSGRADFTFESIPLLDGTYDLNVGVRGRSGGVIFDWREQKDHFEVMNPGRSTGSIALELRADIRAASLS